MRRPAERLCSSSQLLILCSRSVSCESSRRSRMTSVLWVLTLCVLVALAQANKTERGLAPPCDTGRYTKDGECCQVCPPGEGVLVECGAKQTECTQCLDSETFSENYSVTEKCTDCTQCLGLMRMVAPCTDISDAKCQCDYNFFFNPLSGRCERCTVCPRGRGVYSQCDHYHDTICEDCVDETYSDQDSSVEPCLPCTICEENIETLESECTPTTDTVCFNPNAPTDVSLTSEMTDIYSSEVLPYNPESPWPSSETTTPRANSPRFLGHGFNENLIPIYCSILAAVVVGLMAYIVFKRWNSCKQNKQAANNRAATNNQMVTPEGEKLHSDSGISVDTQSLQEQQQQQHGPADVQPQPSRSHTQEQIVVRVDGGSQPDSPPPKV
ncbi:Tumor necrosis factor receptor superfamily member 16 [Oryzias melastigma]|uniref:Tumor necrosis factor receptor superfamily member 16 n=1 Tax=Oryzias melastigma TaxID=30732 RepID=A0A834F0W8_ORYME|nr:Tumor necrosis factor receptor superfamily member 16 [Oryzias melastigma]